MVKFAAVMGLALMALVSSCATNPLSTASTVDQKAFALYGQFVVFEELGAQAIKDPATPASVKSGIKKADSVAKPVMDSLLSASLLVSSARTQLAAGATTQDKVNIALTNLSSWVAQGTPLVSDLVNAVKGATP